MNIDEIALRVAEKLGSVDSDYELRVIKLALAELSKDANPVYFQWRRKAHPWSTMYIYSHEVNATTDDSEVRKLFTRPTPDNTEQIEQRVAEAIAKMCESMSDATAECELFKIMNVENERIVEAVREGKWKEYL